MTIFPNLDTPLRREDALPLPRSNQGITSPPCAVSALAQSMGRRNVGRVTNNAVQGNRKRSSPYEPYVAEARVHGGNGFHLSCQNLTTAALVTLGGFRRITQVFRRIKIKRFFTMSAAEGIRLPFVLGSSGGGSRCNVHTAHGIFHSSCARHYHFSLVQD